MIQEVVDKLSMAIQNAHVDIVPKTVVHMGGNGDGSQSSAGTNTVMDTLLKFITIEKLGVSLETEKDQSVKTDVPVKETEAEMETEE